MEINSKYTYISPYSQSIQIGEKQPEVKSEDKANEFQLTNKQINDSFSREQITNLFILDKNTQKSINELNNLTNFKKGLIAYAN